MFACGDLITYLESPVVNTLYHRLQGAALLQGMQLRWLHSGPSLPAGLDRILLRGLVFHGYHGVYPEVRWCWQ